ncbi:hypothetical protein FIV42_15970 [Persicimonas caeni]|uniref:Uncharacterized protein n=1 Tax=Persicimonas caeni TaxID=2292766 RepID=A0A4Y6PV27_PERCE|nr:hypothetical protein [Persicimonas caeni]QDG52182.1 hypothetical protein FIV42_15970 [Persicimonas caeni]QED33404.1 hypothetical protein FRD00_15965 [Persicimonas caeni]
MEKILETPNEIESWLSFVIFQPQVQPQAKLLAAIIAHEAKLGAYRGIPEPSSELSERSQVATKAELDALSRQSLVCSVPTSILVRLTNESSDVIQSFLGRLSSCGWLYNVVYRAAPLGEKWTVAVLRPIWDFAQLWRDLPQQLETSTEALIVAEVARKCEALNAKSAHYSEKSWFESTCLGEEVTRETCSELGERGLLSLEVTETQHLRFELLGLHTWQSNQRKRGATEFLSPFR